MHVRHAWALLLGLLLGACAAPPANKSFPLSVKDAQAAIAKMEKHPRRLQRPLLILGGFTDTGLGAWLVKTRFVHMFDDERIESMAFFGRTSLENCRDDVIAAVDRVCPSTYPNQTAEVDIIGISMGGLVGRYAATPIAGQRRVNVRRLFTIASPHVGADKAALPAFTNMHRDMRKGSAFLLRLEELERETPPTYVLYPYVRLGDEIVGEENAAPAGRVAWWVPNRALEHSHIASCFDPRIVADIARRLRQEHPFTREPPQPLPSATADVRHQRVHGQPD